MEKSTLNLVTGDKGGVGKSFFTRLKYEWMDSIGLVPTLFDTDRTNATLSRFLSDKVCQIDTRNFAELDELLDELAINKRGFYLIDCGAGVLDELKHWITDAGVLDVCAEYQVEVKLDFVLGGDKDSIQILKDTAEYFGTNAKYNIVKNEARASSFKFYDESKTRQNLLNDLGAHEYVLPRLDGVTATQVDRNNLLFSQAHAESSLKLAQRSRVKTYFSFRSSEFQEGVEAWI